jgi:hypothetical protein
MSWLDVKYASLVSSKLRNFKVRQTDPYLASFSCPYCGDSAKDEHKARGYFYINPKDNVLLFKCHNCEKATSFFRFLKDQAPLEFKSFMMESFKEKQLLKNFASSPAPVPIQVNSVVQSQVDSVDSGSDDPFIGDELTVSDAGGKYLLARKIPKEKFQYLFFVDNLQELKVTFPDYDWTNLPKDGRVVFPVKNRQGKLVGISARAITKTKLRYVILKLREEPMIFGVDKVNMNDHVYVTEGAIDSFFLPNSIAVDGADFMKLGKLIPKEKMTIIFDDEPRNKQIVQRMETVAAAGFRMSIWPSWIKLYGKDINAMILSGLSIDKILATINENTFSGLLLKNAIANWRK